jgi:flagellar biosynthesis anti-sigma factor FlgM
MSNTIPPYRQPALPDPAAGQTATPPAPPAAPAAAAAPQAESVTLSPAAQSGAALFAAAASATGIDAQAVATIRGQLANGSYDVSPEDLAQAIATVLKETTS